MGLYSNHSLHHARCLTITVMAAPIHSGRSMARLSLSLLLPLLAAVARLGEAAEKTEWDYIVIGGWEQAYE